MSASPPILRVTALLDGRPGHEKQTYGILRAMQTMAEVEVAKLHVKDEHPLLLLLRTIIVLLPGNRSRSGAPRTNGPDLLLGTGSRTHLPMLALKKLYGIPAVTCMKPALHLRNRFDLCCVPEHDGLREQGNILLTAGAPNCAVDRGRHRADRGLIVLGGIDEKSHRWDSGRICEMVSQILDQDKGIQWTLSSSPRTPQETVETLGRLAAESDNAVFFSFQQTRSGWIEERYDESGRVWVTADSISMIYEALTAGCQVGILPVHWRNTNGKFRKNEDLLLHKGLVVPFTAWAGGECSWRKGFSLNEAQRCAERIVRQWFPESLR